MHPDEFYSSKARSTSKELPYLIDTLDDAIAYLQLARQTMSGNAKFRLACADYTHLVDEYRDVVDVVLTGKSLLPKAHRNDNDDNDEFVLFAYE